MIYFCLIVNNKEIYNADNIRKGQADARITDT